MASIAGNMDKLVKQLKRLVDNTALIASSLNEPEGPEDPGAPAVITQGKSGRPFYVAEMKDPGDVSWHNAIQEALNRAGQNGDLSSSATVMLPARAGTGSPPSRIRCDDTIAVHTGTRLIGQGQFATVLDFSNAPQGSDGIRFSYDGAQFHHGSHLEEFQIFLPRRHGVHVEKKLGESIRWNNVIVAAAGADPGPQTDTYEGWPTGRLVQGDGFHFGPGSNGTTPLNLGQLGAFFCNGYGLFMLGTHQRTAVVVDYMTSDGCVEGMLGFQMGFLGGSFKIHGWKCEPRDRGKRVIHIIQGGQRQFFFGIGYVFHAPSGSMPLGDATGLGTDTGYIIENGSHGAANAGDVYWDQIGSQSIETNPGFTAGVYRDGRGVTLPGYPVGPHYNGVSMRPQFTADEMIAIRALLP